MNIIPTADELTSVPPVKILFPPNFNASPITRIDIDSNLNKRLQQFVAEKKNSIIHEHSYLLKKRSTLTSSLLLYHQNLLPVDLKINFKPYNNYPKYIHSNATDKAQALELQTFKDSLRSIFNQRLKLLVDGFDFAINAFSESMRLKTIVSLLNETMTWIAEFPSVGPDSDPEASQHFQLTQQTIQSYVVSLLVIELQVHLDNLPASSSSPPASVPMMVSTSENLESKLDKLIQQNTTLFTTVDRLQERLTALSTKVYTKSNTSGSKPKNGSGGSRVIIDPQTRAPIRLDRRHAKSPSPARSLAPQATRKASPSRGRSRAASRGKESA